MVDTEFRTVVGNLLTTYQSSAPKDEESQLSRELSALPLGVAEMLWFFLTPDGRLLAFNLFFDEVTAEFTESRDVAFGLRLGSTRFPELEALMPSRPDDAIDCDYCAKSGWVQDSDSSRYACGMCHGRGWSLASEREADVAPDGPSM